jgi:hypothetical protein
MPNQPKKLLDQVRDDLRLKHYSLRTEQAYVSWIKRYILFHDKRHPTEMGAPVPPTHPLGQIPPPTQERQVVLSPLLAQGEWASALQRW